MSNFLTTFIELKSNIMLHQENLLLASELYEVRHDNNGNAIHVVIKDGDAIIYPTLIALIAHQFMGESNVERVYLDEDDLEELYGSEFYSYASLKKIANKINERKLVE